MTMPNFIPNENIGKSSRIKQVLFTQKMAADALKNPAINRDKKPQVITVYKDRMEAESWNPNLETEAPIIFDKHGRLAGGQHRMNAFVKSGKETIHFWTLFEASDEEVLNQDGALARKEVDYNTSNPTFLKFDHIPNVTATAAFGMLYTVLRNNGKVARPVAKQENSRMHAEIQKDYEAEYRYVATLKGKNRLFKSAPVLAAFIAAKRCMDTTKLNEAAEVLDGFCAPKGSPIALLNQECGNQSNNTTARMNLFLKALHALKSVQDEQYPEELIEDKILLDWITEGVSE